jgi:hypothetical protein
MEGEKKRTPILLGPLDRASLHHWITHVSQLQLYKHPKSGFVCDRQQMQSLKEYFTLRTMDKVHKPTTTQYIQFMFDLKNYVIKIML